MKRRENYESVLLKAEAQQKKRAKVSKYRSTAHITPVSSICEQTNLISKHIINDCRKQMDPSSLEMLMILKLNPEILIFGTKRQSILLLENNGT